MQNIIALFNQFTGKEVHIPEAREWDCTLVPDETMIDMQQLANENGLQLRAVYPEDAPAKQPCSNRLNAQIKKCGDGKYRVTNNFSIG